MASRRRPLLVQLAHARQLLARAKDLKIWALLALVPEAEVCLIEPLRLVVAVAV